MAVGLEVSLVAKGEEGIEPWLDPGVGLVFTAEEGWEDGWTVVNGDMNSLPGVWTPTTELANIISSLVWLGMDGVASEAPNTLAA